MFSKVVATLNNAIEFSPKKVWNNLSPINKSIIKIATAIFALSIVSYYILKKINANLLQSSEQPTQHPVSQEPKKEQSTQAKKESSKNQHNDDDVSGNSKKEKENKPTETVLTTAEKGEEKANLTDLPKTKSAATTPSSVDQTVTKAIGAGISVLKPQITEGPQEPAKLEPSKATSVAQSIQKIESPVKATKSTELQGTQQTPEQLTFIAHIKEIKDFRLKFCSDFISMLGYSSLKPNHLAYIEKCHEFAKSENLIKSFIDKRKSFGDSEIQANEAARQHFGSDIVNECDDTLYIAEVFFWGNENQQQFYDEALQLENLAQVYGEFYPTATVKKQFVFGNAQEVLEKRKTFNENDIALINKCAAFSKKFRHHYMLLTSDLEQPTTLDPLRQAGHPRNFKALFEIAKIDYTTKNQMAQSSKLPTTTPEEQTIQNIEPTVVVPKTEELQGPQFTPDQIKLIVAVKQHRQLRIKYGFDLKSLNTALKGLDTPEKKHYVDCCAIEYAKYKGIMDAFNSQRQALGEDRLQAWDAARKHFGLEIVDEYLSAIALMTNLYFWDREENQKQFASDIRDIKELAQKRELIIFSADTHSLNPFILAKSESDLQKQTKYNDRDIALIDKCIEFIKKFELSGIKDHVWPAMKANLDEIDIIDAQMIATIAMIDYKAKNELALALKEKADVIPLVGLPVQNTLLPTGTSKQQPKKEVVYKPGTHIVIVDTSTKPLTVSYVLPAHNTKSTLPDQKTAEQTKFVEAINELRISRQVFCPDLSKLYDNLVKDLSAQPKKTYLFNCRAFFSKNKNLIQEFISQRQTSGDTLAQAHEAAVKLFGADTLKECETMVYLVNNLYWSSQNQDNFINAIKKLKEAANNLDLFFSSGNLAEDKVLDKVLADMTGRPVVTEKDKEFVKQCQAFCTTYENKFKNASEKIQLQLDYRANISGGIKVIFDLKYIAVS
ncbi:MAG: hypothetical protein H0W88_11935 [Parachlamydiaceae bacterium]|nr:hypothetical protein [Parachlamydiaceae bacterium]